MRGNKGVQCGSFSFFPFEVLVKYLETLWIVVKVNTSFITLREASVLIRSGLYIVEMKTREELLSLDKVSSVIGVSLYKVRGEFFIGNGGILE